MPTYAEFKNLKDLVLGLQVCSRPQVLFPEQIVRAADGIWSVELSREDLDVRELQALLDSVSPEVPGRIRLAPEPPPGTPVPLLSILDGSWSYRDPQKVSGIPLTAGLFQDLDPLREDLRYILAARDAAGAQRLLDSLTDALVTGIRAFAWPQDLQPAPDLRWFWMVTSGDPPVPRQVLAEADRAWWGPLVSRPCQVFVQWPYTMELSPRLLERIPWGPEGSVVLLNHPRETDEGPMVIEGPARPGGPGPLIDVARLQVRGELTEPIRGEARTPDAEFELQIRLVEGTERFHRARRVADLKAEIRTLQLLLARLEGGPDASRPASEAPPEPLFLYAGDLPQAPGQAALLPEPLQRLNVEWTDQPRDLGRLRYLQLEPGSLPPEIVPPDRMIHLLTTATALGEPQEEAGDGLIGLRLRDYLPERDGLTRFELLREWSRFGLQIFLPAGQALRIYPELPSCAMAAEKLASVLLPEPDCDRREWCFLMSPLPGGRTRVCRIRGPFRSLVEASDWKCRFDVPLPEDWVGQLELYAAEKADPIFVESLERAFLGEAREKALERLEALRAELADKLQATRQADQAALLEEAATLEARIRADREWLGLLEARRQEIRRRASELTRIREDLEGACRRLVDDLQEAEGRIEGLRGLAGRFLGELEGPGQETRQVRLRIEDLRGSLEELLKREARPRVRGWRRWFGRGR